MFTALAVSYADRLAAFGMPFLMLQFGGGPEVFIRVEYIVSVSIIVATFADAGLRSYVLYHYGRTRDAERTTLLTSRAILVIFVGQILLFTAALVMARVVLQSGSVPTDLPLGVLRGIALAIIGVATQIFIIHEKPLAGIILSLFSWIIGGIALLLPHGTPTDLRVLLFFSSTFMIVFAVPLFMWRTTRLRPGRQGVDFAMTALGWAWPILIATASSIAVAHITRIYGLATLDMRDATSFAFWMRIFSIVQLSHRAAIVMVSRRIFVAEGNSFPPEMLRTYLQVLLPAISFAFGAKIATPWLNLWLDLHIPDLGLAITMMIGLQVTLWCFSALMELYCSRDNSVNYVMVASGLPSMFFILFLVFAKAPDLLTLASAMAAASLGQFLLLILYRNFRLLAIRTNSVR